MMPSVKLTDEQVLAAVRTVLADFDAAIAKPTPNEWRDVRTDPPPLDEQVVFAYFGPNTSWHGYAAVVKQFQWERMNKPLATGWPSHVEPTHWCPLAKAPDATQTQGEKP